MALPGRLDIVGIGHRLAGVKRHHFHETLAVRVGEFVVLGSHGHVDLVSLPGIHDRLRHPAVDAVRLEEVSEAVHCESVVFPTSGDVQYSQNLEEVLVEPLGIDPVSPGRIAITGTGSAQPPTRLTASVSSYWTNWELKT